MKIPGISNAAGINRPRPEVNKALSVARTLAATQATRMIGLAGAGVRAWDTIEKQVGIKLPQDWLDKPCTFLTITQLSAWWKSSAEERYLMRQAEAVEAAPIERVHVEQKFDRVTLKPQQRKAVDGIVTAYQHADTRGVLLPLKTGKGKSFICAAFINWLKENNYFGHEDPLGFLPPVLYITPRSVVRKTQRTLYERFGLTDRDVLVLHYQALSTKAYKMFFDEQVEEVFGQKRKMFVWRAPPFAAVIVDESHKIKKEGSTMTKRIRALGLDKNQEPNNTFWLFTSATPGVILDDMMTFTMLAKVKYRNAPVTRETWVEYVRDFGDPKRPNAAAMRRWAESLGPSYVNPPDDPSRVKVRNLITLLEWENPEQRARYFRAEDDYIKAIERAGGSTAATDRGAAARATQIFRAAEELIKVESMIKRGLEFHKQGFAPVFALCFQNSVIEMVARLAQLGVPRDKISVIWGGRKIIKPSEVCTDDEYEQLVNEYVSDGFTAEQWSRETWAKFRKSRKYFMDQLRNDLTSSEYATRIGWLESMGLKTQTDDERQREIDRFQSGETEWCIYTLSAGGVGVDLDQQVPEARPRRLQATICYYAEEYQQALGRCKRIATIQSEVIQESLFFAGSIAAAHVAPKLGSKLNSINALASTGIDFSLLLEQAVAKKAAAEELKVTEVESEEDVEEVDEDEEDDEGGE